MNRGVGDSLKLNLGCGDRYAEGWTNVDWPGSPHRKDWELDLTEQLPWADNSVQNIYAGHLLEHLTLDQCLTLLKRLYRVAMPTGIIMVVGPDIPTAQRMAEAGTLDVTMDSLLYGGNRWPGDVHQWPSSAEMTIALMRSAGWTKPHRSTTMEAASFWPVADPRPKWQFAVWAIKETA